MNARDGQPVYVQARADDHDWVFVYGGDCQAGGGAIGMNKETRRRYCVTWTDWSRVRGQRAHVFSAGRGQLVRYRDGYGKRFS